MLQIKRAVISVFNKEGIVDFAKGLSEWGVEILSTGGTAKVLREEGIPIKEISEYTGVSSMLNGRVKTLHPDIYAGILALRDNPSHIEEIKTHKIALIDMVVINFYPFAQVIQKKGVDMKEAVENIDIGGPTMLRSAAKNFFSVAAVTNPDQYSSILEELKENEGYLSEETCFDLAIRVFQEVSAYDALIARYFGEKKGEKFPGIINFSFRKKEDLRYGENPHQKASFYVEIPKKNLGLLSAQKPGGKNLSFNNLLDLNAAFGLLEEFKEPTAVVIKHTNPCGVGSADNLSEAFKKAYSGDPLSAFGSIIGLNKRVDKATAREIASPGTFIEGIIAPDYEDEALKILETGQKWGKNVIILKVNSFSSDKEELDIRKISGGILVQEEDRDTYFPQNLKVVTKREPSPEEKEDLIFAWIVCKHIKSNAIVFSKDKTVVGVGAGQMSRIDSCLIALRKAKDKAKGAVLASDAFFPFPDVVEEAGKAGITSIIQPGGARRDKKVIKMADDYGIAMFFTEMRHFRH